MYPSHVDPIRLDQDGEYVCLPSFNYNKQFPKHIYPRSQCKKPLRSQVTGESERFDFVSSTLLIGELELFTGISFWALQNKKKLNIF